MTEPIDLDAIEEMLRRTHESGMTLSDKPLVNLKDCVAEIRLLRVRDESAKAAILAMADTLTPILLSEREWQIGRHIWDVAADVIKRLQRSVDRIRNAEPLPDPCCDVARDWYNVAAGNAKIASQEMKARERLEDDRDTALAEVDRLRGVLATYHSKPGDGLF